MIFWRTGFLKRIGLLLAVTATIAGLPARANAATNLSSAVNAARLRVAGQLAPKVPGVAVAVAHDGKIIWSEAFGLANTKAERAMTTQTLFRIGSVSKPLTAAGLMLLVEKGKLDLDADIRKYVPDFPDKGHVITTRELAGHLAGIRHYRGQEIYLNKHYASVRESLAIFENDPLLSVPGEKYSYSSYGYNLISAVMEGAAKTNFLLYMSNCVFAPLGMSNTMPDDATREIPRCAKFYRARAGGGFDLEPAVDNSYKWASGGFLSMPEDLVKFGSALLRPGFLTQASLDAMFTSQKTSDGKSTGYGIGWTIARDKKGRHIVAHSGSAIGGTSVLLLDLDSHIALAMTANSSHAPLEKAAPVQLLELFAEVFDKK